MQEAVALFAKARYSTDASQPSAVDTDLHRRYQIRFNDTATRCTFWHRSSIDADPASQSWEREFEKEASIDVTPVTPGNFVTRVHCGGLELRLSGGKLIDTSSVADEFTRDTE